MKRVTVLILLSLILSGCAGGLPAQTVVPAPTPAVSEGQPAVVQPTQGITLAAASTETPEPVGTPTGSSVPKKMIQPENPQVFIDSVQIIARESAPPQVSLSILGSLPTPCNQLHTEISEPDAERNLFVSVYSVAPTNKVCVQIIKEFQTNLDLKMSGRPAGKYFVWVNGKRIGDFDWQ